MENNEQSFFFFAFSRNARPKHLAGEFRFTLTNITFGVVSKAEMSFFSYNEMQRDYGNIYGSCSFSSLSFDFSVSLPEVQRRTLDVAVKNSGGFLSKDKGLLGKVLVGLASEELAKGWTQW